jgi:hypothetical protein
MQLPSLVSWIDDKGYQHCVTVLFLNSYQPLRVLEIYDGDKGIESWIQPRSSELH